MFLHKTNALMRAAYPTFVWNLPRNEQVIYLTFDDGPIPLVTDFVLDCLKDYGARASFFCIGDNIQKHPRIFERILSENHQVGNHTFNHLNGWKSDNFEYLQNVKKCQKLLPDHRLFRPPYGRIKRSQGSELQQEGFQIIMWDVLTGDFSPEISPELCLKKTIRYTENGSIVVMHDSIKAEKNLRFVLPRVLAHFSEKGYRFEGIPA